jgi:nondiscriminating glutamyl-tRNA synthetase
MQSDKQARAAAGGVRAHTTADILEVLRERGWLTANPTPEVTAWCEHAAALLGGHAANRAGLASLLDMIFRYDARKIVSQVECHVVLSRYAARDVIRQLALHLLDGAPLTSERFKEIITQMKEGMDLRGRELFHPIRLALAGRAGEGEMDRVILLLDEAAGLPFAVPVKSARARILEFCAALD